MVERDYSASIAELNSLYVANQVANSSIKTEVHAKYRPIIEREIKERKLANDREFAEHLARVKERSGMPLTVIQDHVLHTRGWDRWAYYRDLAGIPSRRSKHMTSDGDNAPDGAVEVER